MAYTSRHSGAQIDNALDQTGIYYLVDNSSVNAVTSGSTHGYQLKAKCLYSASASAKIITEYTAGLTVWMISPFSINKATATLYSTSNYLNINSLGNKIIDITENVSSGLPIAFVYDGTKFIQ